MYRKKQFRPPKIDVLIVSTTNLFGFEQIESKSIVDTTLIFEEINKELEENLMEKRIGTYSTDSVFDFLETLTNHVKEDFEGLIGEDTSKNRFVRGLTRIFALLLNTKVDTGDKIKKILKIAVETTLKIWQETKLTVHRTKRLPKLLTRNRPTRQRIKQIYSYKIKLTLPEQKQVHIKKNGNVIKNIIVRRKLKYFIDGSARLF